MIRMIRFRRTPTMIRIISTPAMIRNRRTPTMLRRAHHRVFIRDPLSRPGTGGGALWRCVTHGEEVVGLLRSR